MTGDQNDHKPDDLDYWRLCDELSIWEAALLVAGHSPGEFPYVEKRQPHERPKGYEGAKSAITNALRGGRIKGTIEPEYRSDIKFNLEALPDTVSISSRVDVESLKAWLVSRGCRRGFFFPEKLDAPDYLDPGHPRFAPKLAAAVRAWEAVTDPGKRPPKQALLKWLREHAIVFGLTDEDGKPVDNAIDEAAKVANWQPGGGAPKTQFGQEPSPD